jgi:hypothetical protein
MQKFRRSAAARLFRNVGSTLMLAFSVASCGGGGGGSGGGSGSIGTALAGINISGYVVEGPVSGATVKVYRLDAAGARTLLGSAVTDSRGFYMIGSNAPAGASVLVEATGGTYTDEISSQTMPLSVPLRAATSLSGSAVTVSVTPYSEAAVRILEHAATADWSAASIATANKKVADALGGATTLLDFIPVDLVNAPPASGARNNDLGLSLFTSGFSGFAHRLDPNPSTSLASALDGVYTMIAVDEHDDKVVPAFLGGMADFVDHSTVSSLAKLQLKTLFLMNQYTDTPLVDADVNRYKPTGVSTGGATAAMPDDAFQVVGTRAAGSMFNKRGALIAYPLDDGSGSWRTLYSASVAEVFGDGDIGIGRWNGGATVDSRRAVSDLTPVSSVALLESGSSHYALARAATNVPACGVRRLPLVASTLPTMNSLALGETAVALGLTADSSVGFQYASDDTLVGFDIGVRAIDGSIIRYRSTGGADAPWASGIRVGDLARRRVSVPAVTAANFGMDVEGLASGNGENKLVLKIVLGANRVNQTDLAAAFAASTAGADQSGCAAAVGDPGTAIDPAPANGSYEVLIGKEPAIGTTVNGDQVSFRARGELSSAVNLQVGATTPIYELAGTADASIGRIDGPYTLGVASDSNSLPYAVARPGATIPTSGSRHYVLVASTSVVPQLSGLTGELPAGRVQSASLDVYFGDYPIGTPSEWYGSVAFSVSGSVGGVPFAISAPGNPAGPAVAIFNKARPAFGGTEFQGVLAAPTGDYAVVAFTAHPGAQAASGTLLFRAQ